MNSTVLVTAITSPKSATLIRGQLGYMKSQGVQPILISSPGEKVRRLAELENVDLREIPMERDISPIKDFIALLRVIRCIWKIRPDIVNAGTPKAALLCMTAAWICRVKVRIYTIRGFRHESMKGVGRKIMMFIEWITCRMANKVICVSESVMTLGEREGLIPKGKALVVNRGSSNGIDLDRFNAQNPLLRSKEAVRLECNIPDNALVVGFVGRLIERKGVSELVSAWRKVREAVPEAVLLIAGPFEKGQALPAATVEAINRDESIIHLGYVPDVENYFQIMDLFVLPAYWEGFGNVVLEAAAMGVPIVSTDATGTKDAVCDGFNGALVPPRDVDALASVIQRYLRDPVLRESHGKNGIAWAKNFEREAIWSGLYKVYNDERSKG